MGLSTLAIAVSEQTETIEDVYEPFLIREGLLARTPRGRVATAAAYFAFPKKERSAGVASANAAMPVSGPAHVPSTALAPAREASSVRVKVSDIFLNEAPLTGRGAAEAYLAAGLSPAAGAGAGVTGAAGGATGTTTGAVAL